MSANVILRELISSSTHFFQRLAENSLLVDKTQSLLAFLSDVRPMHVILRPRRSGKSTTLTTFKAFFEAVDDLTKEKYLGYFRDFEMKVYSTPQFERHFNQYVVLHFDFGSIGGVDFDGFESSYAYALFSEMRRQRSLGNLTNIDQKDASFLEELVNLKGNKLANALRRITGVLHGSTGRMVLLLVDEHDTPLTSATNIEDCRKIESFLRHVYSATLKRNKAIFGAFIVGILKQPPNGFLAGIPGLKIFELSPEESPYSDCFMFTEEEVRRMYDYFKSLPKGLSFGFDELKDFYCGYPSGHYKLYNPWDICKSLWNNCVDRYWLISGDANFIVNHFLAASNQFRTALISLLNGEDVQLRLSWRSHMIYDSLRDSELSGLLLRAGYLSKTSPRALRIPNTEIHDAFVEWARLAVSGNFDNAFRERFYSILDYAVDGSSSKFKTLLQDCFDLGYLTMACIRGSYQRFLVFGVFRNAFYRKRGFTFAIHKGMKSGILCFSAKTDEKRLAIFYLVEATDEKTLLDNKSDPGTSSAPTLLDSRISDLTRECRVYSLYFWRGKVNVRCSHWSRKTTGVWRRSKKDL